MVLHIIHLVITHDHIGLVHLRILVLIELVIPLWLLLCHLHWVDRIDLVIEIVHVSVVLWYHVLLEVLVHLIASLILIHLRCCVTSILAIHALWLWLQLIHLAWLPLLLVFLIPNCLD